jgi:hypothetical protein
VTKTQTPLSASKNRQYFPGIHATAKNRSENEYYRTEEAKLLMTAKNRESIQRESLLCLNVKTRKDWKDSSSFSEFHKAITQNT